MTAVVFKMKALSDRMRKLLYDEDTADVVFVVGRDDNVGIACYKFSLISNT